MARTFRCWALPCPGNAWVSAPQSKSFFDRYALDNSAVWLALLLRGYRRYRQLACRSMHRDAGLLARHASSDVHFRNNCGEAGAKVRACCAISNSAANSLRWIILALSAPQCSTAVSLVLELLHHLRPTILLKTVGNQAKQIVWGKWLI